jgi:hypothetical protein
MKYLSKEKLESYPTELVEQVKKTLRAYDETYITYENGEYKEMPMFGVYGTYAKDYKFIGAVRQEDIFTLEERIENYESVFKEEAYYLRSLLKK